MTIAKRIIEKFNGLDEGKSWDKEKGWKNIIKAFATEYVSKDTLIAELGNAIQVAVGSSATPPQIEHIKAMDDKELKKRLALIVKNYDEETEGRSTNVHVAYIKKILNKGMK